MKLALFDVDGTLVNSQSMIAASLTSAFHSEKLIPPPRAEMLSIVGLSLIDAMAKLAPSLDQAVHIRLAEAYKSAFWQFRSQELHTETLFDGAADALQSLRSRGDVLLGIASGKSRRGIDHLVEKHGWQGWFVTIQTSDAHPSKPHPSMVLSALAETGIEASDAMVIGDTSFDMEMARAAGAGAIAVSWGNHPVDVLRAANADAIISEFNELVPTLDRLWKRNF
jgi:phosphoglycolate phosphatase